MFSAPASADIYTLSLHDALPISTPSTRSGESSHPFRRKTSESSDRTCSDWSASRRRDTQATTSVISPVMEACTPGDRKSTRLNSSHTVISYAVFCLKKKKNLKVI